MECKRAKQTLWWTTCRRRGLSMTHLQWSSPPTFPHFYVAVEYRKPCRGKLITALKVQAVSMKSEICCFLFWERIRLGLYTHTHAYTHRLLLGQSISRLWLWQRSILFTGRLLHLTFIVAPGPWTSCKRHRSIQCQGPGASRLGVVASLFTLR